MVERSQGFIHRHTPAGRYEEYRAKQEHVLAQTQGEARYFFEKKLDADAKRYARRAVARDVLVAAMLIGGAVFIGREIKNKTLGATLTDIPRKIRELSAKIRSTGMEKTNAVLQHIGAQVAEGAVVQMESHLPHILETIQERAPVIGQAAVLGALSEVSQSVPQMTQALEERLEATGVTIATRIMAALESGLPHLAETFAASLRSVPGYVFFGRGKK